MPRKFFAFEARVSALLSALIAAILILAIAFGFPVSAFAATAGVTADVTVGVNGSYAGVNPLGSVTFALQQVGLVRLKPGTGAGQADKAFADQRTIAASSSENLDLAGVLTDPLGAPLTFVKVKAIIVIADPGNTNNVCVGGAATNTFAGPFADATDIACAKPGGMIAFAAPGTGWTVTPATGDLLKVANSGSGTGVTYRVIIIGTSA